MTELPYECSFCGRSHAYNAHCDRRQSDRRQPMGTIVERLRKFGLGPDIRADIDTAHEAADAYERLEAKNEKLRTKLAFAQLHQR